jgi:hypothetical protein
LWVVAKTKLAHDGVADLAGYYILSDNEMVYTNAKNALNAVEGLRPKGYLRYLDRG